MHGCVFWNSHKIPIDVDLSASFDEDAVSNLITWQDPRCSEEFLATLPLSKNFPAPLSSGFNIVQYHHFLVNYLVNVICSLTLCFCSHFFMYFVMFLLRKNGKQPNTHIMLQFHAFSSNSLLFFVRNMPGWLQPQETLTCLKITDIYSLYFKVLDVPL